MPGNLQFPTLWHTEEPFLGIPCHLLAQVCPLYTCLVKQHQGLCAVQCKSVIFGVCLGTDIRSYGLYWHMSVPYIRVRTISVKQHLGVCAVQYKSVFFRVCLGADIHSYGLCGIFLPCGDSVL